MSRIHGGEGGGGGEWHGRWGRIGRVREEKTPRGEMVRIRLVIRIRIGKKKASWRDGQNLTCHQDPNDKKKSVAER